MPSGLALDFERDEVFATAHRYGADSARATSIATTSVVDTWTGIALSTREAESCSSAAIPRAQRPGVFVRSAATGGLSEPAYAAWLLRRLPAGQTTAAIATDTIRLVIGDYRDADQGYYGSYGSRDAYRNTTAPVIAKLRRRLSKGNGRRRTRRPKHEPLKHPGKPNKPLGITRSFVAVRLATAARRVLERLF